jgi:hypothetical protein
MWIGKDLEGSGRSLILTFYPEIRLEIPRKTTKNRRIASLRAEFWNRYLPNTKQGPRREGNDKEKEVQNTGNLNCWVKSGELVFSVHISNLVISLKQVRVVWCTGCVPLISVVYFFSPTAYTSATQFLLIQAQVSAGLSHKKYRARYVKPSLSESAFLLWRFEIYLLVNKIIFHSEQKVHNS